MQYLDRLPSVLGVLAWLFIMRTARHSGWKVAVISLAGTILHELAHFLLGFLLRAKPVSFSIFPRRIGNQWQLGSVSFTNLNIWNSAFVAFAPLLLPLVGWQILEQVMQPALASEAYLTWLLAGYLVACSLYSCIPSSVDFTVGALSALLWGLIGYGLWRAINS